MEFKALMKQWLRMCKAYPQCEGCKLNAYDELGYKYSCHENGIPCNIDRVESVVMAWAKEHPEPVFPSWVEWLSKQGLIEIKEGLFYIGGGNDIRYENKLVAILTDKAYRAIPEGTAQRLQIDPKGAQ